jgi:hypothetical protein
VVALATAGLVVAWPTIARDTAGGAVPGDEVRTPAEQRLADAQADLEAFQSRTGLLDPAVELRHARQDLVELRTRRAQLVGPEVASAAVIDVTIEERTAEVAKLEEAVRENRQLQTRLRSARAALGDTTPAPVPELAAERSSRTPSLLRWLGAAAIVVAGVVVTAWLLRRRSLRHTYRPRRRRSLSPAVGSHSTPEDSYRWLNGQPIAPVPRVSQDITSLFADSARRQATAGASAGTTAIARRPGPAAASARRSRRRHAGARRPR